MTSWNSPEVSRVTDKSQGRKQRDKLRQTERPFMHVPYREGKRTHLCFMLASVWVLDTWGAA